jgi:hypothetical protein
MLQQEGKIRKAQGPTEIRMALTFSISLIGIGEIVLLPLDVLKIKRQTNPEAFRGRGVFRIVADEGMGLYRGAGWTAARNAPGSFAVRYSRSGRTFPPPPYPTLTLSFLALRRLCLCQTIHLRPRRLQRRDLGPELRCLRGRRISVPHRLRPARRHQDPYPEPKLRKPRVWLQDPEQYG